MARRIDSPKNEPLAGDTLEYEIPRHRSRFMTGLILLVGGGAIASGIALASLGIVGLISDLMEYRVNFPTSRVDRMSAWYSLVFDLGIVAGGMASAAVGQVAIQTSRLAVLR